MEATVRVLNEMVEEGLLEAYAIGGAMAAVFYVEPVATFDLDEAELDRTLLDELIDRYGLRERWLAWTT